jgi:hypothetical protein
MGKYQVQVYNCWSLTVRSGASASYRAVNWVQRNQKFTSSKQKNGWYYLDEKKGWSNGKYLKKIKDLNPAKKAPKKTVVKKPAKVTKPKPATTKIKQPSIDYDKIKKVLSEGSAKSFQSEMKSFSNDKRLQATTATKTAKSLASYKNDDLLNTFGSEDFDTTIADYTIDTDFLDANLDIIRGNYNMVGDTGNIRKELFTRFNRFRMPFPDYYLTKTFSHVFFVRPSLNLFTGDGKKLVGDFDKDPMFSFMYDNNPNVLRSLTEHLSVDHDFHPFLSNTANSFETSDEVIKAIEHGETFTGYKLQYGRHNIESNTAGQFAVSYQDDAELSIYKTHKAWTEYISKVYRGSAKPKQAFRQKKVLDYASAVYYVVCGADGETILFWSKFFGVFPLNTPASSVSYTKGAAPRLPEFSINYAYSMKEDFSPLSLAEFNQNSSQDFRYRSIYEPELAATGRTMSGAPFISFEKNNEGRTVYKLKFRE